MNFSDLISSHPSREDILSRLRDLADETGTNSQMRQNLLTEVRLKEDDWAELATIILAAPPTTGATRSSIRKWCLTRTLRGGPANLPSTVNFYRYISFSRVSECLAESGVVDSEDQGDALLFSHLGIEPSKFSATFRDTPLGRFLMWSTFGVSLATLIGEPSPPLEDVLCALGLTVNHPPYLLLEFTMPSGKAQIPTFCDAYAGDPWNRYFRSSAIGDAHGRTMPTDTCKRENGFPEVVHEVITAATLTSPLRYA